MLNEQGHERYYLITVNRNRMVRIAGKLQRDRKYMSGTTFYSDTCPISGIMLRALNKNI